jgi:restriction system protein
MAIPDYESVMLPLLRFANDGQVHKFGDACDALAKHFGITEQELHLLLPSGRYPIFRSRVSWAKTYLAKALLLEVPIRGNFRITSRGLETLKQNPPKIDNEFLSQYPEFLEFQQRSNVESGAKIGKAAKPAKAESKPALQPEQTPDELLEYTYLELQRSLAQDILKQIELCTPRFFETLVVDLLVAMGYGGSIKDAAQVVGKSGDEGIDGIIKEDRLGLDTIYIQAKKWKNSNPVSRSEIQKFVGALQGRHASKGIFINTAKFAETAKEYVKNLNCKVVLIDGELLAKYMIDFNIGVTLRDTYQVKKIDFDYFSEE